MSREWTKAGPFAGTVVSAEEGPWTDADYEASYEAQRAAAKAGAKECRIEIDGLIKAKADEQMQQDDPAWFDFIEGEVFTGKHKDVLLSSETVTWLSKRVKKAACASWEKPGRSALLAALAGATDVEVKA